MYRFSVIAAMLVLSAAAQQSGGQAPPTSMAACGAHGDIEVICGIRQPEDLELTPDGKFLLATEYLNEGRGGASGAGMVLLDLERKTLRRIEETAQPDKAWGDPACPGPLGDALVSHGSSLARMKSGVWAYYVVNHGGRESIEMFELRPSAGSWALVWHGCEIAAHVYNDVAILPDGGFVGTYPSGLPAGRGGPPGAAGGATGYVARWTPGKGEEEVPGMRIRRPNGVVVSPDGRYLYVNEFGASQILKVDLKTGERMGAVKVDFLPDNLTWTKSGKLLAAGIKGARGNCPPDSGRPCIDGFGVAEIDAVKMTMRGVFDTARGADSDGGAPLMTGVSVALEAGDSIYIGAFRGDRLLRIPYR